MNSHRLDKSSTSELHSQPQRCLSLARFQVPWPFLPQSLLLPVPGTQSQFCTRPAPFCHFILSQHNKGALGSRVGKAGNMVRVPVLFCCFENKLTLSRDSGWEERLIWLQAIVCYFKEMKETEHESHRIQSRAAKSEPALLPARCSALPLHCSAVPGPQAGMVAHTLRISFPTSGSDRDSASPHS